MHSVCVGGCITHADVSLLYALGILQHGFDADAMRVELEIFTEALRQAMVRDQLCCVHGLADAQTPWYMQFGCVYALGIF